MRKKSPKESTIVRSILDELRTRGRDVWFRKNHGGPFGAAGVPDIEVVFRPVFRPANTPANELGSWNGPAIVVFLEVKKPGEKPTKIQEQTIFMLKQAGAYACIVFSKPEAIKYLELLGLPPKKKE